MGTVRDRQIEEKGRSEEYRVGRKGEIEEAGEVREKERRKRKERKEVRYVVST